MSAPKPTHQTRKGLRTHPLALSSHSPHQVASAFLFPPFLPLPSPDAGPRVHADADLHALAVMRHAHLRHGKSGGLLWGDCGANTRSQVWGGHSVGRAPGFGCDCGQAWKWPPHQSGGPNRLRNSCSNKHIPNAPSSCTASCPGPTPPSPCCCTSCHDWADSGWQSNCGSPPPISKSC